MILGLIIPFFTYLLSLSADRVVYSPSDVAWKPYVADPLVPRMTLGVEKLTKSRIKKTSDTRIDFTLGSYLKLISIYYDSFILDSDVGAAIHNNTDQKNKTDMIGYDGLIDSAITLSSETLMFRYAYKHVSSHRGDEYIIKMGNYFRNGYTRDEVALSAACYLDSDNSVRAYVEVGTRFNRPNFDVRNRFRYQAGIDYQPPTNGIFVAIDLQLSPEWGNNLATNFVAGYALVDNLNKRTYRFALSLYDGHDKLREFSDTHLTSTSFSVIVDI